VLEHGGHSNWRACRARFAWIYNCLCCTCPATHKELSNSASASFWYAGTSRGWPLQLLAPARFAVRVLNFRTSWGAMGAPVIVLSHFRLPPCSGPSDHVPPDLCYGKDANVCIASCSSGLPLSCPTLNHTWRLVALETIELNERYESDMFWEQCFTSMLCAAPHPAAPPLHLAESGNRGRWRNEHCGSKADPGRSRKLAHHARPCKVAIVLE
jgi:hypothetical protein